MFSTKYTRAQRGQLRLVIDCRFLKGAAVVDGQLKILGHGYPQMSKSLKPVVHDRYRKHSDGKGPQFSRRAPICVRSLNFEYVDEGFTALLFTLADSDHVRQALRARGFYSRRQIGMTLACHSDPSIADEPITAAHDH
jgi:hypothetical protein